MKHLKTYSEVNESFLIGLGAAALTLLGVNKLLGFILKRLKNRNMRDLMMIFLEHEDEITVKITEDITKFKMHISMVTNNELNLILVKDTKMLSMSNESKYGLELNDSDYNDLLMIIKHYQTKWVNSPKW
jgi:hypothetical protein